MDPLLEPENEYCEDCYEVSGWDEDSQCNKYDECLRFDRDFATPIRLIKCIKDAERAAKQPPEEGRA